jgi:hypothetical protein
MTEYAWEHGVQENNELYKCVGVKHTSNRLLSIDTTRTT